MNGFTRVGAVIVKEFKHLGRDRRMLAVVVLMPIMMLVLFAYALSFDIENVRTIVIDQDHTQTSEQYVQRYQQSAFFDVVARGQSMNEVDEAFAKGRAQVAVMPPPTTYLLPTAP